MISSCSIGGTMAEDVMMLMEAYLLLGLAWDLRASLGVRHALTLLVLHVDGCSGD